MKSLASINSSELLNCRALVRLDLNVPIINGKVMDDFRIISSLPTLEFLGKAGARICIISHCEANKGETCSLSFAATELGKFIPLVFVNSIEEAKKLQSEGEGRMIVIESLRTNEGEKNNDEKFAKDLSGLGDIYVNEAFSVSHRDHASIVGVPKFIPSYAGIQLEKEIKELGRVFNPPQPFVFILGGAKFDTKIPLIQKFLDKADSVFIGGALANDLLKAQGNEVGKSLTSRENMDLSKIISNPKLVKVIDVIVKKENGNSGEKIKRMINDIEPDDIICDVGPETMRIIEEKIRGASCILWNGPLGFTEGGYDEATLSLAQAIADSKAISILGGGDTLSAVHKLNINDNFSFISTGGGAALDFLAHETLPGIAALG